MQDYSNAQRTVQDNSSALHSASTVQYIFSACLVQLAQLVTVRQTCPVVSLSEVSYHQHPLPYYWLSFAFPIIGRLSFAQPSESSFPIQGIGKSKSENVLWRRLSRSNALIFSNYFIGFGGFMDPDGQYNLYHI